MGRIAVFGGSGFTGSNIAYLAASEGWDVLIAGRTDPCFTFKYDWERTDICDYREVEDFLLKFRPDITVNAAAISDIDLAGRLLRTEMKDLEHTIERAIIKHHIL